MKKILAVMTAFGMVLGFNLPLSAQAAVLPLAQIQPGDLIRGTSFPAVYYYGRDGFRYVFPNDKAYFTWYSDFSSVKWISDADMGKVQIGGNVTYRPGVKMIKINSDPKTYAISRGGKLRWVTSEAVAISLFGSNWNKKIDDVPDGFFPNYSMGADIETASDYNAANELADTTTVDQDKSLRAPTYLDITDNAYSQPNLTISVGSVVRWTNKGANKHTATADDLSWGSGTMDPNGAYSKLFKTAGTYTYFCSYHPTMRGTITVQ